MEFFEKISIEDAKLLSVSALAFVGDAVQTLYVREQLAKNSDTNSKALHLLTAQRVKSFSQARQSEKLLPLLSGEENEIFHRARNNTKNAPKHGSITDYKKASGLEAVIGYLYLTGQDERLSYILSRGENDED